MSKKVKMDIKSKSVEVGNKTLTFETGRIARQANGAVYLTVDDTTVFASACAADKADLNIDFFPLRVDYQEKFSSVGKSLGGFIKREGRPSQKEILTSRLIDRPLRPMFQEGYFNEVQILSYVWSSDKLTPTEPLALCAASAALVISDIPLIKPIAGVQVGYIDGIFVINPDKPEMEKSKLDLLIAGTEDAVLMIEGFCNFLTEEQVLEAINAGHAAIKKICLALEEWRQEIGQEKKVGELRIPPQELVDLIEDITGSELKAAMKIASKQERDHVLAEINEKLLAKLLPEDEKEPTFTANDIATVFKKTRAKYMRKMVLETEVRIDGRKTDEIRPIAIEQSLLPRTHGSSLFTRGETQAVAVCTLGGDSMAQRYETLEADSSYRFYLQYFFPPFSVGEVGRSGPAGRREVGHGKLAERALIPILPSKEEFPYVIRLESNITESNGSSSMASVCGGCLSMMDAGVPIKRPVAGIAMGLIVEKDQCAILSDILGAEDALGDMDFKITGDSEGITAFQMDIKVEGINLEIMKQALNQAKEGRTHILHKMLNACPSHRDSLSEYAPRIETIQVKPNKIATIIGPGGKTIRSIVEQSGAEVNINDDGVVSIAATNGESMDIACTLIKNLTAEVEVGKVYDGKVTSVVAFGAFVEIMPGKEGLCHISELDTKRVEDIFKYIKEGDPIQVKVLGIDDRSNKVKLSRKATLTVNAGPK